MTTIELRAEERCLVLRCGERRHVARLKDFEFLCALLCVEDGAFLHREEVKALPRWSADTLDSIGKQVARLIGKLDRAGVQIIAYKQKTNGWAVAECALEALAPPIREQAAQVVRQLDWAPHSRFAQTPLADLSGWFCHSVEALLSMTAGEADVAMKGLRKGLEASDNEGLWRISNVLASRIGQRLRVPHVPVPGAAPDVWSPFEQAVEVRRIAAEAIRPNSDSWQSDLDDLEGLLSAVGRSGDLTSEAILRNAIAVLCRRLGRLDDALSHIRETLPLALLSGDFMLIQNASFNFGNILSEIVRNTPAIMPRRDFLAPLELDLQIRKAFGLGRDSAQAELLLAYLQFEGGDLVEAERYLAEASHVMVTSQLAQDQALFHRVTGLVAEARGHRNVAIEELEKAAALFDQLGNRPAAIHVRQELAITKNRVSR